MSQTYDPNSPENGPEHGQGYARPDPGGWAGYAARRRRHRGETTSAG